MIDAQIRIKLDINFPKYYSELCVFGLTLKYIISTTKSTESMKLQITTNSSNHNDKILQKFIPKYWIYSVDILSTSKHHHERANRMNENEINAWCWQKINHTFSEWMDPYIVIRLNPLQVTKNNHANLFNLMANGKRSWATTGISFSTKPNLI